MVSMLRVWGTLIYSNKKGLPSGYFCSFKKIKLLLFGSVSYAPSQGWDSESGLRVVPWWVIPAAFAWGSVGDCPRSRVKLSVEGVHCATPECRGVVTAWLTQCSRSALS